MLVKTAGVEYLHIIGRQNVYCHLKLTNRIETIFLEQPVVDQLVNKFPRLYIIRVLNTAFTIGSRIRWVQ